VDKRLVNQGKKDLVEKSICLQLSKVKDNKPRLKYT